MTGTNVLTLLLRRRRTRRRLLSSSIHIGRQQSLQEVQQYVVRVVPIARVVQMCTQCGYLLFRVGLLRLLPAIVQFHSSQSLPEGRGGETYQTDYVGVSF